MAGKNPIQQVIDQFSYFSNPNQNPNCIMWLFLFVFIVSLVCACAMSGQSPRAVFGGLIGGNSYQSPFINY